MQWKSIFEKIKILVMKIRPWSGKRKVGDAEFNSLSNCDRLKWRIFFKGKEKGEK